jgi:hypothetical protein
MSGVIRIQELRFVEEIVHRTNSMDGDRILDVGFVQVAPRRCSFWTLKGVACLAELWRYANFRQEAVQAVRKPPISSPQIGATNSCGNFILCVWHYTGHW